MPDLIAGRIDFVVTPTPAVVAPVRGGRLRALASLSAARLPQFGELPAIGELGWPDQTFAGGLFLFAPAALRPLAPSINRWWRDAVTRPEVVGHFREAALETAPLDLEQTRLAVVERLATVDAMRVAVFGRAR
ncbi:MAG: tripartite tricarboxylate transporter substrate-binding protein [Burkholderiaceae bacterium]